MSYAIVKTGGKQYRVEQGQSLLVERLHVDDGAKVELQPLLYVDGSDVVDADRLSQVTVQARVVGHERGPKLRIVKFKPKRGYKRRTGHRQELTRLEVTEIKVASKRSRSGGLGKKQEIPKPVAADRPAEEPEAPDAAAAAADTAAAAESTAAAASATDAAATTETSEDSEATEPTSETDNGS
jgi:large subunit ribosomal protein L21